MIILGNKQFLTIPFLPKNEAGSSEDETASEYAPTESEDEASEEEEDFSSETETSDDGSG